MWQTDNAWWLYRRPPVQNLLFVILHRGNFPTDSIHKVLSFSLSNFLRGTHRRDLVHECG